MSQKIKETSLNIIALEYGSSDSDVEETNTSENTESIEAINKISVEQKNSVKHDSNYRNVEEISSTEVSDSEDDSEDSDSSTNTSSDENESDVPNNSNKYVMLQRKKYNNKSDYLPPLENLNLSVPEVSCELLGKIQKIVEEVIVIEPLPDKPRLDIETILFINQGRQSLGRIFDVYGKVSEPYYCVRFNSSEHAQKSDIVGKPVYYCPNKKEYTSLIFLHELIKIKACDPIGDDESPDFSSDEEEKTYYAQLSTNKNNNGSNDSFYKRRRTSGPAQNRVNNLQANHLRKQTTSNNQNVIKSYNFLPRYPYQSNTWSLNMRHTHSNPYIPLPRPFFASSRLNYDLNYPISYYNVRPYTWHPHGLHSQSLLPPPPPPPPLLPRVLPLPPRHSTNNSDTKPQ